MGDKPRTDGMASRIGAVLAVRPRHPPMCWRKKRTAALWRKDAVLIRKALSGNTDVQQANAVKNEQIAVRIDKCVGMCVDMCVCMCADMHVDMRVDVCIGDECKPNEERIATYRHVCR